MGKIYIGNSEVSFCVVDNYTAQCLVQGKPIDELHLPITSVRNYIFYNYSSVMNKLYLPYVTSVGGRYSFENFTGLREIYLDRLSTLPAYLFSGCTNLNYIFLPSLTTINNERVFNNCNLSSIEENSFPNVQTISGDYVFYNTKITEVSDKTFPKLKLLNGSYVFSHCTSLTKVDSSTLQSVRKVPASSSNWDYGQQVFSYCTALKTVNLPDFTRSGLRMFEGCTALETVSMGQNFDFNTNIDSNNDNTILITSYAFYNCNKLKNLDFGDKKIRYLADYAFYNCSSLEEVDFTYNYEDDINKLTEVPPMQYCFAGCTSLKGINAPYWRYFVRDNNSCQYAFQNCKSLKYAYLPSIVQVNNGTNTSGTIYYYFNGCTALEVLDLHSITSLYNCYFMCDGCSSLKTIQLDSLTSFGSNSYRSFSGTAVEELELPELRTISASNSYDIFRDNVKLVEFNAPNLTNTSTCSGMFIGCVRLKDIDVSKWVTVNGNQPFRNCYSIEELDFSSLTTLSTQETYDTNNIVKSMCNSCPNLKKVWLPKELTTIGNSAVLTYSNGNTRVYRCPLFYNVHPECIIYTDAPSKPSGWGVRWNARRSGDYCKVVWGATHEDYENDTARKELYEDEVLINPCGFKNVPLQKSITEALAEGWYWGHTSAESRDNVAYGFLFGTSDGWCRTQFNSKNNMRIWFRTPNKGILSKYEMSFNADNSSRIIKEWKLWGYETEQDMINNVNGTEIDHITLSTQPTFSTVNTYSLANNDYKTQYYAIQIINNFGDGTYTGLGYTRFYMHADSMEGYDIPVKLTGFTQNNYSGFGNVFASSNQSASPVYACLDGVIGTADKNAWVTNNTTTGTWQWSFVGELTLKGITIYPRHNATNYGGNMTFTIYGRRRNLTDIDRYLDNNSSTLELTELGKINTIATTTPQPYYLALDNNKYDGIRIEVTGTKSYVGMQEVQLEVEEETVHVGI